MGFLELVIHSFPPRVGVACKPRFAVQVLEQERLFAIIDGFPNCGRSGSGMSLRGRHD
jgi:hypothetical protein